jgi:hypothetical protein
MPKRISKRPTDISQVAFLQAERTRSESEPEPATESDISRVMSEMGRKGGRIGGKRRMETMTPEERTQVALGAAKARWAKRKKSTK